MTPLINGTAYSWAQIRFEFFGIIVQGVTAISWEEKQEKKDMYASGDQPYARGYGNKTYTAKISLAMNEVENMRSAIPDEFKSFLNVPAFPITVQFMVGTKITTKILQMCEFTNDGVSAKQGDMGLTQDFDLITAGIKHAA